MCVCVFHHCDVASRVLVEIQYLTWFHFSFLLTLVFVIRTNGSDDDGDDNNVDGSGGDCALRIAINRKGNHECTTHIKGFSFFIFGLLKERQCDTQYLLCAPHSVHRTRLALLLAVLLHLHSQAPAPRYTLHGATLFIHFDPIPSIIKDEAIKYFRIFCIRSLARSLPAVSLSFISVVSFNNFCFCCSSFRNLLPSIFWIQFKWNKRTGVVAGAAAAAAATDNQGMMRRQTAPTCYAEWIKQKLIERVEFENSMRIYRHFEMPFSFSSFAHRHIPYYSDVSILPKHSLFGELRQNRTHETHFSVKWMKLERLEHLLWEMLIDSVV